MANKRKLYLVPHQDDELLTMGLDIIRSIREGEDVSILLFTDGAASVVRNIMETDDGNAYLERFVEARDREFVKSCRKLGIKEDNIIIPALSKRGSDSDLTVDRSLEIIRDEVDIRKFECICTISSEDIPGRHSDHSTLGKAAALLPFRGFEGRLLFFTEPYLAGMSGSAEEPELQKATEEEMSILSDAADAYRKGKGIGSRSVHALFDRMETERSFVSPILFDGADISGEQAKEAVLNADIVRDLLLERKQDRTSFEKASRRLRTIDERSLNYLSPEEQQEVRIVKKRSDEDLLSRMTEKIIVSMTSFPRRIGVVSEALKTIAIGSLCPDGIILWLLKNEFPKGNDDLPASLLEMSRDGLVTVRWCDNDIGSNKKYLYTMKEYPDDNVITVDDDLYFSKDLVRSLYLTHLEFPNEIIASRCHIPVMSSPQSLAPYREWIKAVDIVRYTPSGILFFTSGAGTLFPPGAVTEEFLCEDTIKEICRFQDDLWLNTAALMTGRKVVRIRRSDRLNYIPGTQENTLFRKNGEHGNDESLKKIVRWAEEKYGRGTMNRLLWDAYTGEIISIPARKIAEELKDALSRERRIERSFSYRLGRRLTYLPRKIRNMFR